MPNIGDLFSWVLGSTALPSTDQARAHGDSKTHIHIHGGRNATDNETGAGSKKRALQNAIGDGGRLKKVKVDRDATHLTPQYGAPAGARPTPIGRPTTLDKEDTTKQTSNIMSKTYTRGGHRPTNTLGNFLPQAAANPRTTVFTEFGRGHTRVSGSALLSSPELGGKAALSSSQDVWRGKDGFSRGEISGANPAKRRKLDFIDLSHGSHVAQPAAASTVDLTGDDNPVIEEVVTRNTRKAKPAPSAKLFENAEWKTSRQFIEVQPTTRRRKSKDGARSSVQSGHAAPAESSAPPHSSSSAAQNGPFAQFSDEEVSEPPGGQIEVLVDDPTASQSEPPTINLTSGFDQINGLTTQSDRHQARLSDCDEIVKSLVARPRHDKINLARPIPRAHPEGPRKIVQDDPPANQFKNSRPNSVPEDGLRHKFIRDNASAEKLCDSEGPQRQRASERLNGGPTSAPRKTSPVKHQYDSSSADELAGDTTIHSPAKRNEHAKQSSQIAPTHIEQDPRNPGNLVKRRPPSIQREDVDPVLVELGSFYAQSCVADRGHVQLRLDEDNEHFEVLVDGVTQQVPGRNCIFAISASDVHKVFHSRGSTKVCLSGPRNTVSHGKVCVEFRHPEHAAWFVSNMYALSGDSLVLEKVDLDKLEKMYHQTYRVEAQQAAERLQNKVSQEKQKQKELNAAAKRTAISNQKKQTTQDEEQIIYEQESDDVQPRPRRSQLLRQQAGESESHLPTANQAVRRTQRQLSQQNGPNGTTSPYFDSDGPATRKSSRIAKPVLRLSTPPPRWTTTNIGRRWQKPVVYPQQGIRRVTVDWEDMEHLDDGEFLNDNCISFALRYIEEHMEPEHRKRVHFFNSFFFTALTTKNGKRVDLNYDAVKRWTKNVDIMSTDYVVVPININLHWFLAIICNCTMSNFGHKPEVLDEDGDAGEGRDEETTQIVDQLVASEPAGGKQTPSGNDGEADEVPTAEVTSTATVADDQHEQNVQNSTQDLRQLSLTDEPKSSQIGSQQADQKSASTSRKGKKKKAPPPRARDAKEPTIITLDSFGNQHSAEIRFLKEWICAEASDKRREIVTRDQIKGMTAQGIPHQANFHDCGVYVAQYVERFAKDPEAFVTKVLQGKLDQEAEFGSFDASQKRQDMRDLLMDLQAQQYAEYRAKKKKEADSKRSIAVDPESKTPAKEIAEPKPTEVDTQRAKPTSEVKPGPRTDAAQKTAPIRQASLQGRLEDDDQAELELSVPRALKERAVSLEQTSSSSRKEGGISEHAVQKPLSAALSPQDNGILNGIHEYANQSATESGALGQRGDMLDGLARVIDDGTRNEAGSTSLPVSITKSARPKSPGGKRNNGIISTSIQLPRPQVVIDLDEDVIADGRIKQVEIADSQ